MFGATCVIAVTTAVVSVVKAIKPTQNTIQSQNNAKERCHTKFSRIIHVQNVYQHVLHALLSTVCAFIYVSNSLNSFDQVKLSSVL